jgi:hypothetical protein
MPIDRRALIPLGSLCSVALLSVATESRAQSSGGAACDTAPAFWLELSRLCAVEPALAAAAADSDESETAAGALGYCRSKASGRFTAPAFAARSDAERAAIVDRLAELSQAPRPPEPAAAEARMALVELMLKDTLSRSIPGAGGGTGVVLDQFVSTTCTTTDLSEWLPATCSSSGGDLRTRLMRDMLGFAERGLAAAPGMDSGLAAAILAAVSSPDPVRALIEHLASRSPAVTQGCEPRLPADDGYRIAAALLLRLKSEARAASSFSAPELSAILLFELDRLLGRQPSPVSPLRERAARRLGDAWLALSAERERLAHSPDLAAGLRAVEHLIALGEAATTLATDRPQQAPAELARLIVALHRADGMTLLSAARTLAGAAGVSSVPENVVSAAETALRLAAARNREEAERILRGAVFGRWSERVIFDINGGVPILTSTDLNLNGDLTLGYHFDNVGVMARGAFATYDVTTPAVYDEMVRMGGGADLWYATGAEATTRFEVRALGELFIYDSSTVDVTQGNSISDQTSLITRAQLMAALRLEPPSNWVLGIWLGGGAQLESYNAVRAGGVTVQVDDQDKVSFTATGRLRGEWGVAPDSFALRLRIDGQYYDITRDSIGIRASTLGTNVALLAESAQQLDLMSRLYADLELLAFGGFVPGLFAGADYTYRTSPTVAIGSYTPVFGAGLRRAAF